MTSFMSFDIMSNINLLLHTEYNQIKFLEVTSLGYNKIMQCYNTFAFVISDWLVHNGPIATVAKAFKTSKYFS